MTTLLKLSIFFFPGMICDTCTFRVKIMMPTKMKKTIPHMMEAKLVIPEKIFLRELKDDWTLAISCALNPSVLRVPKVSCLVTCVNICDMINTYLHKFYSMLNAWNLHHIVHVVCVVCGFVVCEIKWYNENISWNLDFLFIKLI